MAPRSAATRTDATAVRFLKAATALIDGAFRPADERGRHPIDAVKFPAAVDWLRVEDVLRVVAAAPDTPASRKAFANRWPDKDTFMRDAIVYALCYNDAPARNPNLQVGSMVALFSDPACLLEDARRFSEEMFAALAQDPRSMLFIHLTPLIGQHPEIKRAMDANLTSSRQVWRDAYAAIVDKLGLTFRKGWSVVSLDLTLQALLDGFIICDRARHRDAAEHGVLPADLFADAVCAVVASAFLRPGLEQADPVTEPAV